MTTELVRQGPRARKNLAKLAELLGRDITDLTHSGGSKQ